MNNKKYAAIRPTLEILQLFQKIKNIENDKEQNIDRQSIYERALDYFNQSNCDIKLSRKYEVQFNQKDLIQELPSSFKLKVEDEILNQVKLKIKNEYNLQVVQFPFLLKIILKSYIQYISENKNIDNTLSLKRKQVYDILMTPIIVENKHTIFEEYEEIIKKEDGKIISSQKYWCEYLNKNTLQPFRLKISLDQDVSDIACKFYEVIYQEILGLNNHLVKDNGDFQDAEFMGDTMNSFHTIANKVPEAGKSRKQRTSYENWPSYLQNYYDQYHCLANFWLLPGLLGRSLEHELSKTDRGFQRQDYMDRFLKNVQGNFDEYVKSFKSYFKDISSFEQFINIHQITGSYVYLNNEVYSYSKNKDPEIIVNMMVDRIKLRANTIVQSNYLDKLWDLFCNLGLIEN